MRLAITIACLLALPVAAAPWFEEYERGVRLIEQGKAAEAKVHLEAALRARGDEGLQLPVASQKYLDYLPHLYLAIASQMGGDVDAARKHLALAEDSGVAVRSELGRPLLVAYQLLLRGDGTGTLPRYAVYDRKDPVLTEEEFQLLRKDILEKCDLPPDTRVSEAPWYANYELGLALEKKGDYTRALTHFIDAVSDRPNPQKQARMYGMWLVDYYPYFHIARSHTRLENWECARNAIEISQRLGEIPNDAPEVNELVSLQRETEKKLAGAQD